MTILINSVKMVKRAVKGNSILESHRI